MQFQAAKQRHLSLFLGLLLLSLALVPAASIPAAAALSGSVDFDSNTARQVVSNDTKSVLPDIVTDSNNKAHIVYVQDNGGGEGDLAYINNVSGNWSGPQYIQRGIPLARGRDHSLAIDRNNVLHLVYIGNGQQVFYRQGTIRGASVSWSGAQQISEGKKSFSATIAIDSAGNAHIAWIDNRCGEYNVFYRVRRPNGSLSDTTAPRGDCVYQTGPRIVVTNDGKPHIVFQRGSARPDIYYARLDGSTWVTQNLSNDSSTNSVAPTLATDGVGLYAAWGESLGGGNHDVRFRYSPNGGTTWSSRIDLSNTPQFAEYPDIAWSATARRAYIVWSDVTNSADANTNIWFREFDPGSLETGAADRVNNQPGASDVPAVSTGPARIDITWQDRHPDNILSVFYTGGAIRGSGPSAKPAINDGAVSTNDPVVTVSFSNVSGSPTQVRWKWNAPPTDADNDSGGWKPFANPLTNVPRPATSVCGVAVLYTQVRNAAGAASAVESDSIIIDPGVDPEVGATLDVLNPHLAGLPTTYSSLQDLNSQNGASDGDPRYTREDIMVVRAYGGLDCTGIDSVTIGTQRLPAPANGFLFAPADVPDKATGPGRKDFNVVITDKADGSPNTLTVPRFIVYDPPGTNDAGLPVLTSAPSNPKGPPENGKAQVSDTTSNQRSILRTLSFNNIAVNDNLYGKFDGQNLPAGRQFWGVWVANTRDPNTDPLTDPALKWTPVRVTPGDSFAIQWSVLAGLGVAPAEGNPALAGDYYVYVRFLDGAGNPSKQYVRTKVTLPADYQVPKLWLPIEGRN